MSPNHSLEFKNIPLELKDIDDNGAFSGFASVYNKVDQGGDMVMPGAFAKSIAKFTSGEKKFKMLWQHDTRQPIGVWDKVEDTAYGLKVYGRALKSIRQGAEAHTLMKEGVLDGLSIGFKTIESAEVVMDEEYVRQLKGIELWEVSTVTFPMETNALVTDVKQLQGIGEVERILRDAGVPNKFAKMVAAYGFTEAVKRLAGDQRDADEDETIAQVKNLLTQLNNLKGNLNAR